MKKQITLLNTAFWLLAITALCGVAEGKGAIPKPTPVTIVRAEYKRLIALRDKLDKIPMEKLDREPNKSFIRRNKKDIVYSDPAGQWFVRSDSFWRLSERNKGLPIADDIAWTAANNPLPGECEGYTNCYLYGERRTLGRYLEAYPKGKHTAEALSQLAESFTSMSDPSAYDGPTDAHDKAELQQVMGEFRAILAKVPGTGKDRALTAAKKLAELYK